MSKGEFTLDDFMAQMAQVRKLGPMGKVMGMIPGMQEMLRQVEMNQASIERSFRQMESVYDSMTPGERADPDLIDASRRRRIARGAGVRVDDVAKFILDFNQSRQVMRAVGRMGIAGRRKLDAIMGLVTDSPIHRDPSYVHSDWRRSERQGLTLALAALAVLVALACAWRLW